MKTDNVDMRVNRVVNKRYKRDLLLCLMAVTGLMIGAVLLITFLKPHFAALDKVEPEVPAACFSMGLILIAFIKYARK